MSSPAPRPRAAEVVPLPALVRGLPAPPPRSLDPFLDAAAACFAKFGIRRTSVQDVADAAGVNRATVYRQVGNVESMLRLLSARDLHRLLADVSKAATRATNGPDVIVGYVVAAVEHARAHPVVAKVLADEPRLLGSLLDEVPEFLGRIAAALVPILEAAIDAGVLAPRDPVVVAEWLSRIAVTAVVAPPPGDLHSFLAELLVPALAPAERRTTRE
jgi:AcrR family transcriptional regulator